MTPTQTREHHAADSPAPAPSRDVDAAVDALAGEMNELLSRSLRHRSVSGEEGEFTRFLAGWAGARGWETDLWETEEAAVSGHPQGRLRHLPLAGRPTLVVRLPGRGAGRSLLFNAHSDVVGVPDPVRWSRDPWGGLVHEGKMYGRGACDTKGPLIAALWAMRAVSPLNSRPLGDVMLELVPGEEDCVGLGTLTSVLRGHRADGVVVLEPTENHPRCASRGGLRFEIACTGKAVHGTVKWLGRDAIALARRVMEALEKIERRWDREGDDPLFGTYPILRPITVDRVGGGGWAGMICDECVCTGYLELLPQDDLEEWKHQFDEALREELGRGVGGEEAVSVRFTEEYRGHRANPSGPLCKAAEVALGGEGAEGGARPAVAWAGFNSGCEAGLRATLHDTPTLVWGPGSLVQAHAADEWISLDDLRRAAGMFARLILAWCGGGSGENG